MSHSLWDPHEKYGKMCEVTIAAALLKGGCHTVIASE